MTPAPPVELAQLAPGWEPTLAYRLVPWLTTWRLSGPDGEVRFAKVDTSGNTHAPTLRDEADRMRWAADHLSVPRVVALEELASVSILLTDALPGRDGTDPVWRRDLPGLVRALAAGLRALHDAVPPAACPFRFEVVQALEHVRRRVAAGDIDPRGFHREHTHLSPQAASDLLEATAPAREDLVVCHGDYCPPNVLLTDGEVCGYVDLGELGVADRWWDVAVGAWSAGWNFGRAFEPLFYESYGVTPDPARIAFYRLLYDLVS